MEDPLRLDRRDELLDRAGVGQLAVQQRDSSALALVAQAGARRIAALDEVDLLLSGEVLEVLHARAPPVRAVDGDVGVVGEDVFGKVASGEAGDAGDQDPHSATTIAIAMPVLVACRSSVPWRRSSSAGPSSRPSSHS